MRSIIFGAAALLGALGSAWALERALDSMNNHRYIPRSMETFARTNPQSVAIPKIYGQEIKGLLYDEMRKSGVLSLAARWDCPRWTQRPCTSGGSQHFEGAGVGAS
jgi:hypothetical protein